MNRNPAIYALSWLSLYVVLTLIPAFLMLVGTHGMGRGAVVDFAIALGFIALAMLCLQFVITGRFLKVGAPFNLDVVLHFHRQLGICAALFILMHVGLLLVADAQYLTFLDPWVNLPRAFALWAVLGALGCLIVLSVRRKALGVSYEVWRLTHAVLASVVLVIGFAHVIMVSYFSSDYWKQGVWTLGVTTALYAVLHIRVILPASLWRTPWSVRGVHAKASRVWTIVLEAISHGGLQFRAGQYAWLTFGAGPFALKHHPFTISSSPSSPTRLEFTVKELGDFTASIGTLAPGTKVFVEGPYGHFTLRAERAPGTVFLAGGIGVTPVISMLRSLRDEKSSYPVYLFYATRSLEDTPFLFELAELSRTLNLVVVHVVEHPPADWQGERGLITKEMLSRHLTGELRATFDFMMCGPEAMLQAVQESLKELGVPAAHRRQERFNIV